MKQMNQTLANLKKSINFEIELITPEKAEAYLNTSLGNRNIKQDVLKGLVNALKQGTWSVNGETIVIDRQNHLLDGHHRLEAIRKAQVPAICIVVMGIERSTWTTMDSGTARSLGDVFKMEGISNYAIVSTAVSGVLSKIRTNTTGINTLGSSNILNRSGNSRKDALNFYYDYSALFQTMATLSQKIHKKLPCFSQKEIIVISCYLAIVKKYSSEKIEEFWNLVVDGSGMYSSMRSHFINDFQEIRHRKMSAESRYSYIATIWNYYIQNKYVRKVRYVLGEHVELI